MKKSLFLLVIAMVIATGLTQGQNQFRPLPIYRYFTVGAPDNLNVMDSAQSNMLLDTTKGSSLLWGGWDTAAINTNVYCMWYVKHFTTGGYYELEATGYASSADRVTDQWFISPYFNTTHYTGVTLGFASECAKYAGHPMEVMVSTSYKGGVPDTTKWSYLTGLNIPSPNGTATSGWKLSSTSLDAYQGDSVCIAFRYTSNTTAAATYYVDSIQITGTPITVGIKNIITTVGRISVYPNPSSTNVTIESPQQAVIEILNIQGQLIETLTTNSTKTILDVSALTRGVYIVEVKTENGIEERKLVKE
jgi:hypothetical protein